MALDRLTKIDGGGISTTSDYRVGIITASKFVGPFDGTGGNFSGIITASGANFSGNVSIGGTLTYEDVTNIDSVGIITARDGLKILAGGANVVGVVTASGIDCNGDIDVDGHTNLDNVSIAGVATLTSGSNQILFNTDNGNIEITRASGGPFIDFKNSAAEDFDVRIQSSGTGGRNIQMRSSDGTGAWLGYANNSYDLGSSSVNWRHLYVNNVNITGVTTMSGNLTISNTDPRIIFVDTNNNPDFTLHANGGVMQVENSGSGTQVKLESSGSTRLFGNVIANKDLDVDGHTNLDNVSVAGVTTVAGSIVQTSGHTQLRSFSNPTSGAGMELGYDGTRAIIQPYDRDNSVSKNLYIAANVGINQLNPTAKLDVAGDVKVSGTLDANGDLDVAGTSKLSGDVTINRTTGLLGSKLSINKDADQEGIGIQLNQSSGITTSFTTFNSAGTQTFSLAHDTDGTPDLILKLKHSTNSAPAEKVRITSGGNVNIGTGENTQTVRMLNVYGGAARVTQTSGGNTIEAFGGTTSGQSYGLLVNAGTTANDYAATFRNSGGTTLFRVRGDGNIGVGINNPSSILHVSGGSTPTILNKPTDATPALFVGDSNRTGAGQHLAEYRGNWNGTTVARMVIHAGDDTTNKDNGDITFRTAAAGSTIERVRITSDGKMGLGSGITSPIADFEIYKNSGISSCVVRGPKALLAIMGDSDNTGASETDASLMFTSDSHTILNSPLTAHGFEIALLNEEPGSGLRFHDGTNNAERLRITSDGVIGINDTNPGSGKKVKIVVVNNSSYQMAVNLTNNINADINFYIKTNESLIAPSTNTPLCLGTGGAEKLKILSNGHLITQGNNTGNPVGMELRNNNTADYSHAELTLTSQNAISSKVWCDVPNAGMRLQYNGGTTVKVNQSGNLVMASGSGIDFSSTGNGSGSMTNELLDDYEEGTWTPTAHSGGSGISNISATYTRVGRIVHVQFRGYITGINGSLAQIGGLPYANWQSYAHQVGPVMHNGFDFPGSTEPTVTSYITGTNSYFQLYYSRTNSGGWVHATGNDTGGDQFITSLTYFVA